MSVFAILAMLFSSANLSPAGASPLAQTVPITIVSTNVLVINIGTTWKLLGSTQYVSARVNMSTDPSVAGVPAYSVEDKLIRWYATKHSIDSYSLVSCIIRIKGLRDS